jgi:CyaY protein
MTSLGEAEYEARAFPELKALMRALDALDDEAIEAELESDILTLEFRDGARFVINSHRAARQIWMAANRSAWHFDWDAGSGEWRAAKTGDELWSTVSRVLTEKLGRPLTLSRPS